MTTLLTEMRKEQKAFYSIQAVQVPPQHDYSPDSYGYNPNSNAYQSNVCDDPYCDCQPQSSYAYEPPSQYSPPPYSQASYHNSPSYDPNPYPLYQPPYEPYLEPPPFQHQYSHELQSPHTPPQEFHQYEPPFNYNTLPSNNEPYLPPSPSNKALMLELRDLESCILRQHEEDEKKFKALRAKTAIMVEAISNIVSSCLSLRNQGTPIVECGEVIKELSKGVELELQGGEEELKQEVQQEEKVEMIEPKEVVVGTLGYVEYIKKSQIVEPFSMEFEVDVEGESAQPPRHNVIEEWKKCPKK
ncbi:glutenin, low molecular weight subunit-like [Arachis stenosperma]|uniref:glutenin, low molecular weight subunit-like n=1 Tax=Arachis stenosperma TaxID=217475 RepID=UPI0025ACE520|nr:glutenin, low molecular weight subunit-like [Arachis stenosperma]